uniref:Immunoglobulin domain-containing protein n=1 Tax=Amphiprion percula TaxID=161767 RepID=A0A3P8SDE0_AMPPE
MGANWVSQRTTTALIVTLLQIRALISVKTTAVTGVEGQTFDFRCEYPSSRQSYAKYFCRVDDKDSQNILITSRKTNGDDANGKYSIKDKGNTFTVTISDLTEDDSGTYWCGIDRFGFDTYNEIVLTVKKGELIHNNIKTFPHRNKQPMKETSYWSIVGGGYWVNQMEPGTAH